MSPTPHDQYVPLFSHALEGMALSLETAEAFFREHPVPVDQLMKTRIYPEMFPFELQLQISASHPARLAERLGVENAPLHESPPADLAEAIARMRAVKAFMEALPRAIFDEAGNREIVHRFHSGNEVRFNGLGYIGEWVLPNFFFHKTVAYLILRSLGVPVTKKIYMGGHLPA